MSGFKADYAGIGQMLRSAEMEAGMLELAEKAKTYAEAIAPVDEHSDHPGRYKAAFRTESGRAGGYEHDRAYANLVNDAEEALWVEVGSKHNDAHHVLARSIDAIR